MIDYESTVERLRSLREGDDESRWSAGDVALYFLSQPMSEHSDHRCDGPQTNERFDGDGRHQ